MICYGKSAPGLGESLNIPGTTEDLMTQYPAEVNSYLLEQEENYNTFCLTYFKGRRTNTSLLDFIRQEHKRGAFLPDVVTGQDLIDRIFENLPHMANFLKSSAETGVMNKFITTPDVFQRVRRYPMPNSSSEENSIRRTAQNYPIQASAANMTKYAICLIKRHIEANNLHHKLKFCIPLHDEIRYIAREDFAKEALEIIISKMEEAGEFILGNKLQKAEGEISDVWCK
jgi:hypothetical protein